MILAPGQRAACLLPACTPGDPWVGAAPLGPLSFLSRGNAGLALRCQGMVGAGAVLISWHSPQVPLAAPAGYGYPSLCFDLLCGVWFGTAGQSWLPRCRAACECRQILGLCSGECGMTGRGTPECCAWGAVCGRDGNRTQCPTHSLLPLSCSLHIWPVPSQVAVPTQDVAGTPARLNTHRWEQAPSSPRPSGRTGKVPAVAVSTIPASQWQEVPGGAWAGAELCGGRTLQDATWPVAAGLAAGCPPAFLPPAQHPSLPPMCMSSQAPAEARGQKL